ncbi:autophagy-related protein 13-domain-containing protein [Crepidotus variabilis]|uniref:Autophagy-related protein 13 n=1 Tax=Crepidotus variabilis TaxID=179855 RepID=A0A9P6EKI5_9AGAR|nr:autophagy-related protein 13-domain-containing protein [Crepidotus variabilis]
MSNDIQKADQIAFHFYTKLFYVINDARATEGVKPQSKVDKWFNLETPDSDLFSKESREPYKNISQSPSSGPPPLEIQVVLAIPELTHNQVLVHSSPDSSRVRIEPTPKFIVLETWTLECAPHRLGSDEHLSVNADTALPIIYKHGIILFRSIFSLLRILPTWKFYKRLRRRTGKNGGLSIQLHIKPLLGVRDDRKILDFDEAPSPNYHRPLPTSKHAFPTISHILGIFTLSATYLNTPNFQLDELESLLSSRFISLDKEEFVPTLEKHRQRDSISGSSLPSSSGIRSVLSRSPPRQIARATSSGVTGTAVGGGLLSGVDSMAVAERFIIPPVIGSSASTGTSALIPPPRPFPSMNPSPTNVGSTSSPSGLAINRLRKESMNSSSSSSLSLRDHPIPLPSAPGTSSPLSSSPSTGAGVPIRKPSIFKSNTVSSASGSSPSLSARQGIPSSLSREGGAIPAAGGSHSRQPSSNSPLPSVARLPPSPIGSGFNSAHGGTPSSLGDRRPGTSGSGASSDRDRRVSLQSIGHSALAGGGEDQGQSVGSGSGTVPLPVPTRKRYSSSFGHRYAGSGGSSSTGLGTGAVASGAVVGSAASGQSGLSNISGGPGGVTSPLANTGPTTAAMTSAVDVGVVGGTSGKNTPASIGSESRKEPAYLNTTTDDDDISIFVQDIDSRKPLLGRQKQLEKRDQELNLGQRHDREDTDSTIKGKQRETRSPIATEYRRTPLSESPITTSPLRSRPLAYGSPTHQQSPEAMAAASTSPSRGMMLTSQGEVDEKLSKMKETFFKSLEGLGSSGNGPRRKQTESDSLITTNTSSPKTSSVATPFQNGGSGAASASGSGSGSGSSADPAVSLSSRGMNLGLGFPSREPTSTSDSPKRGHYGYYNTPSLGLGLGGARYASASSSTLASSDVVNASQGSEEVIGKMDLYEERRRGGYPG